MKKLKLLLCVLTVANILTVEAAAAAFDSAGNKFDFSGSVIADKNVEGDYIAFGQSVKLESGVKGDIIAGGRTIVVTDDEAVRNIFAAGQYITVHAKSARNVYAAGGDITVGVGSDVKGAYLIGGTVSFGGTAADAYMAGASVIDDGTVSGNITIRSDHITFGRNASVGGHLTVIGTVKPQLPPNIDPARMTFKRIANKSEENKSAPGIGVSRFKVITAVIGVVTAVVIALLLTLFRGGFFKMRAAEFKNRVWKVLLFGFLTFIVVPVAAVACMLTVFAVPVSLIVLTGYAIVLYLSPVITGIVLGRLLLGQMNRYLSACIGAAVIKLLLLIPILKIALFLACAFYALGISITALKPRKETETEAS